jgi:DNA polymerase-3 subunit beta
MKIEFLAENVEKYLPTLTKILPIRSQIPILSNLLLEANREGFFVSTTNLEIGVRIKIPAKIEEEGASTVPGKQFIETMSTLNAGKVELSTEKESLVVRSGGNRLTFQTIAHEEFPRLFDEKGEKIHAFEEGEVAKIFAKVIFSVALDDARPELTGILLSPNGGDTDIVTTDGFRLSRRQIKNSNLVDDQEALILPARLVNEALSIKDPGNVTLYVQKLSNQVIFETENVIIVGRLINGNFPNYQRVIPSDSKTKIVVDKQELIQKIRLVSVFAQDMANVVKFHVEDNKIALFSRAAGVGESEVYVEGQQTGVANEIAFNAKFLNDLLKNLS